MQSIYNTYIKYMQIYMNGEMNVDNENKLSEFLLKNSMKKEELILGFVSRHTRSLRIRWNSKTRKLKER